MKILKLAVAAIVLAIAAFFLWNSMLGPLKYKRDMHGFAGSLGECAPSIWPVRMFQTGMTQDHIVDGLSDGKCNVRIETMGPHVLHCAFDEKSLPEVSRGFADLADQVSMFGGYTVQISTSNPDPLTEALNSDACANVAE